MTTSRSVESVPESHFVLPSSTPTPPAVAVAAGAVAPAERGAVGSPTRRVPMPMRRPGTLWVGVEGAGGGTAQLRRAAEGGHRLGGRVLDLAESQGQLLGELRLVLQEMDNPEHDVPRARIAAKIAELGRILDWCDEVQHDLVAEGQQAVAGIEPIDLLLLCQDVVHDLADPDTERPVQIAGSAVHTVWGDPRAFGHLLRLGIDLVAQRTAGWSDIHVTVSEEAGVPMVRIAGLDGARREPDAELVGDFRAAAQTVGVQVLPDASGPDGTGLELHLPAERRGPPIG